MTKDVLNVREAEKLSSVIKEAMGASPTSLVDPVTGQARHLPFSFVTKFEELRKALLKYSEHKHWCHVFIAPSPSKCSCGLDELLDKYDYEFQPPPEDRLPWGMVAVKPDPVL